MSYFDKVFFDYRKKRVTRSNPKRTQYLESFIEDKKNAMDVYDYRLFYVLKANMDEMVKFGIAGTEGGSGGMGRLRQYLNIYGRHSELNPCLGVELMYLAGTKYKRNDQRKGTVPLEDSLIFKKELACKRTFTGTDPNDPKVGMIKDFQARRKDRGRERVFEEQVDELFKIIDDRSNKTEMDKETEIRTSSRLQQQILLEDDIVLKVIQHYTKPKSRAMTTYILEWNRPVEIDGKKDFTTQPNYRKAISYPGKAGITAKKAIDTYEILNKSQTFRH